MHAHLLIDKRSIVVGNYFPQKSIAVLKAEYILLFEKSVKLLIKPVRDIEQIHL